MKWFTQIRLRTTIDDCTTHLWKSYFDSYLQDENAGGCSEENLSIVEEIKQAAEEAVQGTGYVYDEATGLYFDKNSGYYYDAVSLYTLISDSKLEVYGVYFNEYFIRC